MEVFFKASVNDTNNNFIAELTVNSMTSSNVIATINDFSDNLKSSMSDTAIKSREYEDGEDSIYVNRNVLLYIYDDIRGILKYEAMVSYRLKTLVHFEHLSLIGTTQRRNDVKVKLNIPLEIAPIMENTNPKAEKIRLLNKSVSGMIIDLSAGGIAFGCNVMLDKDLVYNMIFDKTARSLDIDLKIMRETQRQDNSYVYGCKFQNITSKDEELIRQYVFKALAERHTSIKK